jgi:hypothetical protein
MRAVAFLLAVGCSTAKPVPPPTPPVRAATAGDALLAWLPAGADVVVELDVARLRANAAIGPVVDLLAERAGVERFGGAELVVAAVYRLARPDAATVVILRGDLGDRSDSRRLDERTIVVGPRAERERVAAGLPAVAADPRFLTLRAGAMPARATGSVLRVTARLDRTARIDAAGRLGVDEVPATVSLWADVADDAALVAQLGGDDEDDAARLADLATALHARLGRGDFTAKRAGATARVVWSLGPRRLAAWARETQRRVEAP